MLIIGKTLIQFIDVLFGKSNVMLDVLKLKVWKKLDLKIHSFNQYCLIRKAYYLELIGSYKKLFFFSQMI